MQAKSCWAVVLMAAWDTSVPWLEMTVHVALHPRNMVIAMLRFPSPLTAAATEIVISCLEIAADMAVDFDPPAAWRYVPTAYHWLLLYECLQVQIEVLNDVPLPALVAQLTTLATAHDALYLSLPTRAPGVEGFHIDFDALIDTYFWDTDFLLDAESFARLSAEAKTHLGFSASVFGVTQRLAPHPEELVLRRAEE